MKRFTQNFLKVNVTCILKVHLRVSVGRNLFCFKNFELINYFFFVLIKGLSMHAFLVKIYW